LRFECTSPRIEFLSTTHQFVLFYKTALIQICHPSTLGTGGLDLSIESSDFGLE